MSCGDGCTVPTGCFSCYTRDPPADGDRMVSLGRGPLSVLWRTLHNPLCRTRDSNVFTSGLTKKFNQGPAQQDCQAYLQPPESSDGRKHVECRPPKTVSVGTVSTANFQGCLGLGLGSSFEQRAGPARPTDPYFDASVDIRRERLTMPAIPRIRGQWEILREPAAVRLTKSDQTRERGRLNMRRRVQSGLAGTQNMSRSVLQGRPSDYDPMGRENAPTTQQHLLCRMQASHGSSIVFDCLSVPLGMS